MLAKTRSKTTGAGAASAPAAAAPAAAAASSAASAAEDKKKAEALKAEGNALMSKKQHQAAIDKYTEAIKLDPNPVFYSNRAAAWGALGKHEQAAEDAERAIDLDPNFSKGYSRLA